MWSLKVIIYCRLKFMLGYIHQELEGWLEGENTLAQAWGRASESQHTHDPRAVRVQAGGQLDLAGWGTLSRIPRLKGLKMKHRAAHLTSSCGLQEHRHYYITTYTVIHTYIYTHSKTKDTHQKVFTVANSLEQSTCSAIWKSGYNHKIQKD